MNQHLKVVSFLVVSFSSSFEVSSFLFFSVANHTAFYLESEVKQALCDDECRAAASQLEKAVLDQARSNTGYKAQIIARRKEIEGDTHCSSLHTSFQAQKAVEVAEIASKQSTSSGFMKASELLASAPIMNDSDDEPEVKVEVWVEIFPYFLSIVNAILHP